MNYSTAVMLINDNIRAIAVSYETMGGKPDGDGIKPFKIYKTLDQSIKVGDYVVVPTDSRHGMTVVRVEEVDVDIDFDDPKKIEWAIVKVDGSFHDEILKEEEKWIDRLKTVERKKKRKEMREDLLEDYNEDGALERLQIASMTDGTSAAIEPPPSPSTDDGSDIAKESN